MTSAQIRQSFLDFFREKRHTIVPSSSLLPDSPNLLFTNAGMNQFVPIFLGQRAPDVSKWAGALPALDTRAADTQKCIRAGGKHNDLEDVGLDTYHHTFFEMVGNWSFGDYFKKEAIEWAWELVVERWGFPAARLYATIYKPGPGDPSEFDQEAWDHWARLFRVAGLDPGVHIVNGNKKDNFWMMGDTGPCGPCSELHVDLTPAGDTAGRLVNQGSPECIEIWNLVFIQFNANPDGSFSPLPAKHVDTGMGFERVTSILQCTKGFTDFAGTISNYETDVFRPIFDEIEKLSGKRYASTLPAAGTTGATEQEKIDVAFRVIADHIRTLSFAVADGIQPGNTDRSYVLRRILRRAVRYGRALGLTEPFFYKLVAVLARTMGEVFPEVRAKQQFVEEVLRREEEAFNKTLDKGLDLFNEIVHYKQCLRQSIEEFYNDYRALERDVHSGTRNHWPLSWQQVNAISLSAVYRYSHDDELNFLRVAQSFAQHFTSAQSAKEPLSEAQLIDLEGAAKWATQRVNVISGKAAFLLYDTYGFPIDLTELMAREQNLTVDLAEFERLMDEQRERGRAARKTEVITVESTGVFNSPATEFVGYEHLDHQTDVLGTDGKWLIVRSTPFYAEMGGQIWDTGSIIEGARVFNVKSARRVGNGVFVHWSEEDFDLRPGDRVRMQVNSARRHAIERHHTVTHLLHWALHEVTSPDATQKGSFVGPEKLTFDFNSPALTPRQVRDIERLVNEKIVENAPVRWTEVAYADIKGRPDIMQFFGDKYGEFVRVVQIGGLPGALNGYSMELCAGTHTRSTGEIGMFRIGSESAVAAGVRRIEAVAGLAAYDAATADAERLKLLAGKLNAPLGEIEKKVDALLAQQKQAEKQLKAAQQSQAAVLAKELPAKARTINGTPAIIENLGPLSGDQLQDIADALKGKFPGVIVLAGTADGQVALLAAVSAEFTAKFQAGKIIQQIAPIVGGKGGGRPDNARGAGRDVEKVSAALEGAIRLLG